MRIIVNLFVLEIFLLVRGHHDDAFPELIAQVVAILDGHFHGVLVLLVHHLKGLG